MTLKTNPVMLQLTPEFIQKVNDTVCEAASDADIIVITQELWKTSTDNSSIFSRFIKSGAVVKNMNADVGGNCELTKAGEIITTETSNHRWYI